MGDQKKAALHFFTKVPSSKFYENHLEFSFFFFFYFTQDQHHPLQRGSNRKDMFQYIYLLRGGVGRQLGLALEGIQLVCFLHRYQQLSIELELFRSSAHHNSCRKRVQKSWTEPAGDDLTQWNSQISNKPSQTPVNRRVRESKQLSQSVHSNTILKLSATRRDALPASELLQIIYPEFLTKICIKHDHKNAVVV